MTRAELATELDQLLSVSDTLHSAWLAKPTAASGQACNDQQTKVSLFVHDNGSALLAALREPDEAAVERAAIEIHAWTDPDSQEEDWEACGKSTRNRYREIALAALRAAREG